MMKINLERREVGRKKAVGIYYSQPSTSGQKKISATESWFCAICQED
jgi:hypothetical protein